MLDPSRQPCPPPCVKQIAVHMQLRLYLKTQAAQEAMVPGISNEHIMRAERHAIVAVLKHAKLLGVSMALADAISRHGMAIPSACASAHTHMGVLCVCVCVCVCVLGICMTVGGGVGLSTTHPSALQDTWALRYGKPLVTPRRAAPEYLCCILTGSLTAALPWHHSWAATVERYSIH